MAPAPAADPNAAAANRPRSYATRPLYFDYAATTPVDPRVAALLAEYLTLDGCFANPASEHAPGRAARDAVDSARAHVADLLAADPREIVWTSGATESNNLALKGVLARQGGGQHRHVITSKTEHKAVLDVCAELERGGCDVSYLDPLPDGRVDPDAVAAALRPDTVLVSLMHVNNETGAVNDIATVGRLTRERGVLLHVDAAQSVGKLPIDVGAMNVDLLSLCAHKIYGPKGVGALYVRRRPKVRVAALLHGGGHERGLRAGTLPTHQLAAAGEALRIAAAEMANEDARLRALRLTLWRALERLGGMTLNGSLEHAVAGILNVSVAGVSAEALLEDVAPALALSAGSACTSASVEPSHVLRALGADAERAAGALRLSIGRFTQEDDIKTAIAVLAGSIERLRALSPLWPQ